MREAVSVSADTLVPDVPGCGKVHGKREVGVPRKRRADLDVGRLTRILEDDRASRDLRLYFGVGLRRGELPPFTGGRFEFLGDGGDRADICNRFTASDILSL